MTGIAKHTRAPLAIVGGGAAAAWLLILLKRALGKLPSTVVIEPRGQLGLGVAYSSALDVHRLNVTAEKMDLFPEPGVPEFAAWLTENTAHAPSDYVSRNLYGRYLSELLAREMNGQPLEHRRTSATRVAADGEAYLVQLADGETIHADNVVLALGNPPSRRLYAGEAARIVEDPLGGSLAAHDDAGRILVVGAGLTAIDAILELEQLAPGREYTVVAPHPFFPPGDVTTDPVEYEDTSYPAPSGLWKWVKDNRGSGPAPRSWFAPVDGLRPHANAIWQSWTPAERATFLRHCARRWLHLRHRAPPQAACLIDRINSEGRLALIAGRATVLETSGRDVRVCLGASETRFECVINATGPNLEPRSQPLLSRMVQDGLARPDPLRLGIEVDGEGRVLGESAGSRLFALGVWTRGSLWEVVAVPHIRDAARRVVAGLGYCA